MTKGEWILLSVVRNRLLNMWLAVTAILSVFLLIQANTGMIAGIEKTVWFWFVITMLPGLFLLAGSIWSRRYTDKVVGEIAYHALLWLILVYLLIVLLIFLLSRVAIDMNDYGLDIYYRKTFWLLVPYNLLIITGLSLVLFSRKGLFKPSSAAIMRMAEKKEVLAQIKKRPYQVSCFECIKVGNLEQAFVKALDWYQKNNDRGHREIVLLEGRFHILQREKEMDTLREDESQIEYNKIMVALIDLIKDIDA
jgi:hypothetical protein